MSHILWKGKQKLGDELVPKFPWLVEQGLNPGMTGPEHMEVPFPSSCPRELCTDRHGNQRWPWRLLTPVGCLTLATSHCLLCPCSGSCCLSIRNPLAPGPSQLQIFYPQAVGQSGTGLRSSLGSWCAPPPSPAPLFHGLLQGFSPGEVDSEFQSVHWSQTQIPASTRQG